MSSFELPNREGNIRQINRGDKLGELWGSFNIDLSSSPGKIRVSRSLKPIFTTSGIDGNYQTIGLFEGSLYTFGKDSTDPQTGSQVQHISAYRNLRIGGNWSRSYSTSFDVDENTDSVVFNGLALVSNNTNIDAYNDINGVPSTADWWTATAGGSALTSGKPHTLEVSRIGNETLFITNGNKVHYMNITSGPTYNKSTVTLATQLTASCLAVDSLSTWVGTYSDEGNAYVYEIYIGETDEFGTPVARNAYKVDGTAVLSMTTLEGTVYILTDAGHIQVFNGRAFVTVASFPFAFDGVTLAGCSIGAIEDNNTGRAVHPKGMKSLGKSIFININTDNQLITDLASNPLDDDDIFTNVVVNPRSSSGIWDLNTETGNLNHRYSFSDADSLGYHRAQASGPLLVLNNQYTSLVTSSRLNGVSHLFVEDPSATQYGWFITPEIDSQTVQDAWEKLALKHEALEDGESIVVKYRTSKTRGLPLYSEVSWTGADAFVSTSDCSMVEIGDEVEVIDGYGAGHTAHITSINQSLTTYTFELNTDIGEIGETNYVRFNNWKLATLEDNGNFQTLGLAESSTWVQFKVVLTGDIEIRHLLNKGTAKTEM